MGDWVDKSAIQAARKADLYSFMLSRHRNEVVIEGDSLRLRDDHSVSIKRGYSGYLDFSTGAHGNSLDFLQNYLNYDFQEAVTALTGAKATRPLPQQAPAPTAAASARAWTGPPPPVQGQYRNLFAYLTKTRQLPAPIVQRLISDKILYQEAQYNSIIFTNPQRTFYEVRGTSTGKPFHQVQFRPDSPTAFWWFKSNDMYAAASAAYVCEAAIDAISLYCIHQVAGQRDNALYCGIGGVANQQRIDAIKAGAAATKCQVVIAVDNDEAGEKCRQRNNDCPYILPRLKDWNEDWIAQNSRA